MRKNHVEKGGANTEGEKKQKPRNKRKNERFWNLKGYRYKARLETMVGSGKEFYF